MPAQLATSELPAPQALVAQGERQRVDGSLLHGRDMLCFSHDWSGDPLSKTHLMRLLARDNRILWVNSIGYRAPTVSRRDFGRAFKKVIAALQPISQPEPNLFVLNPLVVPSYGRPSIQAFNRRFLRFQVKRAMRRLGFSRPINWVFNPAASLVAGTLGEDLLVYYCVDEYTAFKGVSTSVLVSMEERLLRQADLVLVSAERLYQSKSRSNPHTALVRHGVDFDHFRRAATCEVPVSQELTALPAPILGYFGLIAEDWVDVELLVHVARSFPSASLVLVGKVTMDVSALERLPNVHLVGRRPYADLPSFCRGFDVALIPFPVSEVTANANPLKAREYLAAGLPVVSTPVPEVEALGQCWIGSTPAEFVSHVQAALKTPGPSLTRSETMREHSWRHRLSEIENHLWQSTKKQELTCSA